MVFHAAFVAAAQTNSNTAAGRPMSLTDCIQQAVEQNFDVQVQRENTHVAFYNLQAAYEGYDPTLAVSGQHAYNVQPGGLFNPYSTNFIPPITSDANTFNSGLTGLLPWGLQYNFGGRVEERYGNRDSVPFDSSQGSFGVTLTQPLLKNFWIDQTRLNIRVAKSQLKITQQALRGQLINSISAVVTAYYELIFALQNVRVQEQALALAHTQLAQDQERVKVGAIPPLSLPQDEVQVSLGEANLIAAQRVVLTDQNTLKNLLTDRYSQWGTLDIRPTLVPEASQQTFDLQASWARGLSERPDLAQAKLNIEQLGVQLKYFRNQVFPELDLIGTYGFNGGGGDDINNTFGDFGQGRYPYYSYGAQLSIPLGNVGPRNRYAATRASMKLLLTQLGQLQQNIMVQIDDAVKQAQSDYQAVQTARRARSYAETALDAEEKSHDAGKASTFEVLQYQNSLTAARSQEIRALATYNQTLANLAQQEGSTLEKYNINLDIKQFIPPH